MKTLILYYSKSGHTRDLAAAIHKVIGGDMSELKSQRKYSSSYGMTILQAGLDKFRGRIPETEPLSFNLNDYDVIFLGCPTWYFTMAPAMQQFLSHADLKGKHVFTFSTSGGSPKRHWKICAWLSKREAARWKSSFRYPTRRKTA